MRDARLMGFNDISIKYFMRKAEATRKTPAQVVGEMVRREIAAST